VIHPARFSVGNPVKNTVAFVSIQKATCERQKTITGGALLTGQASASMIRVIDS